MTKLFAAGLADFAAGAGAAGEEAEDVPDCAATVTTAAAVTASAEADANNRVLMDIPFQPFFVLYRQTAAAS